MEKKKCPQCKNLILKTSPTCLYCGCLLYTSDAADDGIRDEEVSRGLGDVYKRQGLNYGKKKVPPM